MYPELLKIGPITIYSYGLMLGLSFLVGNLLLSAELKRRGRDVSLAASITMVALVFGIIGAKLFHLFEYWSEFLVNPVAMAFSSSGLTWYGGFLLAVVASLVYMKWKKVRFLDIADLTAPSLAIGYGIARIGCHLAGDGDYGIATDLPWKVSYEYGTSPTAYALDPITGTRIPTEWVHPTPVYELIAAILLFAFLYWRRKKSHPLGNQFGWFLLLHSLSRFLVEFIRINPRLISGFSEAQLISIPLIVWGAYLILRRSNEQAGKPLR